MEKVKERTGIYHEHQQGALCAQHAMNNLLQHPIFSADELAVIARDLDAEERSVLTHTSHISENMDDTGFFSIQVIQRALKTYELDLVPFASQENIAKQARNYPETIEAYICNLGLHWFAIRRFGRQYFELNSMFYVPKFLNNRALEAYLNIIRENGYSVFIVQGTLPHCIADEQLRANPISEGEYELLIKDLPQFMIDGKTMDSPMGSNNRGRLLVKIPHELYKQFERDPDNKALQEMIYSQIPKDILGDDMLEDTNSSNPKLPHHRRRREIVIASALDDDEMSRPCNNPRCHVHHHQSQKLPKKQVGNINNNTNEGQRPSQMRTQLITQISVSRPISNNPNVSSQQQIVTTRQFAIISQSSNLDDLPIDDLQDSEMIESNMEDEEFLMKEAMLLSLLDEAKDNIEKKSSLLKEYTKLADEHAKKLDQAILDKVIAVSLLTSNSHIKSIEQTPKEIPTTNKDTSSLLTADSELEIIKTSPPSNTPLSLPNNTQTSSTQAVRLEPEIIKIPSSTSTPSSPSINIQTANSIDTNSLPSTNVHTPLPANAHSESPVDTSSLSLSTTTNSSSTTVTDSAFEMSPTVEEFRQRRLRFFGNKDRSIISVQSNSDD